MAIANGTCVSFCNQPKAHFGLPWVRLWDIRGKYQTHRSMYPSIFNRLRAIARYWSGIATFPTPLAFNASVGGVPIGILGKRLVLRKLESWGYQEVKTVCAVSTQYQRVTDRQSDVQPISRTYAVLLTHVKNRKRITA